MKKSLPTEITFDVCPHVFRRLASKTIVKGMAHAPPESIHYTRRKLDKVICRHLREGGKGKPEPYKDIKFERGKA